jgi:replicative DNA helicase
MASEDVNKTPTPGATPKSKSMRRAVDIATDYLTALNERNASGKKHYMSSGFKDVDKKIGGWLHEGHLIVVAGRPAMGKSAFAQQVAEQAAELNDRTTIFVSLEMSSYELIERSISRRSGIPVPVLKLGVLRDDQWSSITMAMSRISVMPMMIDDASFDINSLVSKIKAAAAGLEASGLPPIGLVVVDYLQLVTGKGINRTLEIGQVTGGLKQLAKELQAPVMALSQLNRAVEGRNDKRPGMADLRESGSIEQDADLVMFLYRDEYYDEKSRDKGMAEVIVSKNRHGETSTVKLAFIGERVQFGDLLYEPNSTPASKGKRVF